MAQDGADMDDLSHLQKKLDEIGVMFYTCVGVMQRDAPPAARAPDEADETANDNAMREELAQKAPDFATQIVKASREIDSIIDNIDQKMQDQAGSERELLDSANQQSLAAGKDMSAAAEDASKLLVSIRQIIAARENDDDV